MHMQNPAMSAYQIFKAVLAALAQPNYLTKPVAWPSKKAQDDTQKQGPALPQPPNPSAFKQSAAVFLLDPSGWLNLTAAVSTSVLAHVWLSSMLNSLPD